MLSPRLKPVVFITLMAMAMSVVMSFAMTVLNHKLDAWFVQKWLRACAIAFVVALPTALTLAPILRSVTDRICR